MNHLVLDSAVYIRKPKTRAALKRQFFEGKEYRAHIRDLDSVFLFHHSSTCHLELGLVHGPLWLLEMQPSVHSPGNWKAVSEEGWWEWFPSSSAPFKKPTEKDYTSFLFTTHQTSPVKLSHMTSIIFKETLEMLCFSWAHCQSEYYYQGSTKEKDENGY